NHPDLVNRLIECTGETCGGGITSDHGTHTAGIMAADGSSGILDPFGFLRGLGMAPGANLVEQVYSPFFQEPGGMLFLMTESQRNGASLSGNSWGPAGTPQGYDDDTMQVDIGVRDADPDEPGNQPLSFVLSFMNGGGGTSTQGTPDEAKNIFTIGSTKMQNASGQQILEINDLSSNSAHGPALDGRTIPHMVAPGCEVDSTVPGGHDLFCGTSMASPHVSGAVALFIEYYRNLPPGAVTGGTDPSPALIKAAFLPVSHDLAGNLDADGNVLGHPFDSKQGWGRMDTEAVVDPQVNVRYFDNPVTFDNTGEEWVQTFSAQDPSQPVRLMLVWTDAPGHGLGGSTPAWNNNLDLVVESGGDTYYGNNFGPEGWSQADGSPDGVNNTEGVFLGPTAPGGVTVHVVAADINSDGIPNQGDETDQDFALVCYNCALQADFTMQVTPTFLELCAPDPAVYELEIGSILGYDDPVTLSTQNEPAGTTVDFSTNPVTPPGSSTLTIGNTGNAAPGSYEIDIIGVAATSTHTTTVGLDLFAEAPDAPNLTNPPDGATGVGTQPTFQWEAAEGASSYTFELASDPDFTDIIESASGIEGLEYQITTTLDPLTTYYWRVSADNVCGSSVSEVFSFTTGNIICEVIPSTDVPVALGDAVALSELGVSGTGSVEDVNVLDLAGTHTWINDLVFTLLSPTGTGVSLMGPVCSSEDNFDISFDDEAAPGEPPCPPTDGETYQPDEPLATFDGEEVNGTWTLRIEDIFPSADDGVLESWSLEVCYVGPGGGGEPDIEVEPTSLEQTQPPDTVTMETLTISNVATSTLTWEIEEEPLGAPLGGWSDNFDAYATGSQLHGQGGWKGWGNDPTFGALTSDAQAISSPNSAEIVDLSDLVHEYSGYTSGQWVYTAWQYIPTDMVGQTYFILLNTYTDDLTDNNWSTQVWFNTDLGIVSSDPEGSTLPLITGEWVELRIEIDLEADLQRFYYGGDLLYEKSWTDGLSGGGALNIGAVDLYANGATPVYYDDMSLQAAGGGGGDCSAPGDVPWLSVEPTSGTTPGNSSSPVAVSYDSGGLTPGAYAANL
ncbi:MAG: S8 family serine peptidase, partial [Ardenticatenaceae bacterium]